MLFEQLFRSLAELESAIRAAKAPLMGPEPSRPAVLERLESYEHILVKQRRLALHLRDLAMERNWSEVSRHVKLISGLSQMIRDDALEIVGLSTIAVLQPKQSGFERTAH